MTTLINEHTLTTPLLQRAGELARQLEDLAGELHRLAGNDGFLRQAGGHEFAAVRAAAAAARTAGVDVHLVVSEIHGRALAAGDCGHGYRVTDSCPMCDAEAAPLLETRTVAAGRTGPGPGFPRRRRGRRLPGVRRPRLLAARRRTEPRLRRLWAHRLTVRQQS